MSWCRTFTLGLLLVGGGSAALAGETWRIATYNLRNYLAVDRRIEGQYRPDYPKPEAEKTALRAVIRSINADVLAVQEIGSVAHLRELQRDLAREGLDYSFCTVLEGADPDRRVGVLARVPCRRVEFVPHLSFPYLDGRQLVKRGLLEVVVGEGASATHLFVVHLKSRYTDDARDPDSSRWRASEAEVIRDYLLAQWPEPGAARFVLVGDLNAGIDERPLRALARRGETKIAEILPAADSRGEVWTYFYAATETYRRVDHILVSPRLAPLVLGATAQIADGPAIQAASDHRPVWIDLAIESLIPVDGNR